MAEQYQNDLQIELDTKANDVINTLPDFSKKFFTHLKNKNMSQRTRLQYAYDMRRFFDWLSNQAGFKNVNITTSTASEILDKLTYDDIQEYLETLDYYEDADGNKKISSPSAKARKISSLRSFYKFYFKIHEINNNLADLMELPKIPDKSIITMDSSQSNRLLNIVFDTTGMSNAEIIRHDKVAKRDYAIMMLFLGTGIRVSELVGADINDIDFHNASLLVTRKGGDQDEAFLNAQVLNALEDYLESDRDSLLKGNNSPALFISMHAKRISVRNVEMLIKTYAQKAGLNFKITPHALRRSFASYVYDNTGDISLVAEALHHSSVETTRKHYANMSREHKKIASEVVANMFKEKA